MKASSTRARPAAPTAPRKRPPSTAAQHIFVTGYPGFLAKRLVRQLQARLPLAHLALLVHEQQRSAAMVDLQALADPLRVRIISGDVSKMDLGLSGQELASLAKTTLIFHLAGIQRADAPAKEYDSVNVDGVRNVLAVARELPLLTRVVHFSSCLVSGTREGVITEDELDCQQQFRTPYEASKFRGERLMRAAMTDLPITVLRPSLVVGSTQTGEIDRFDGVYAMGLLVVSSPVAVALPLPGPGTAPLNLVPVDFVTRACVQLAQDPRAASMTYHIVDPNPLSARHVYDLIAKRAGKRVAKNALGSSIASRLTARALRLPGVERLSKRRLPVLDLLDRFVVYNCANTLAHLEGTQIVCPRFDTYVDKLMAYVSDALKKERTARRSAQLHADPYDG